LRKLCKGAQYIGLGKSVLFFREMILRSYNSGNINRIGQYLRAFKGDIS